MFCITQTRKTTSRYRAFLRSIAQFWTCLAILMWVAACQTTPLRGSTTAKKSGEAADAKQTLEQGGAQEETGAVNAASKDLEPAIKLSPQESARKNLEDKFLKEAEIAFRAGKFFEPGHDNAYDRFQTVLMLNPQNSLARSGVQAILLSYSEGIRDEVKNGRAAKAAYMLKQAELRFPANPLLMELKKEIAALKIREEEMLLANEPEESERVEYPLPTGALSRRSATVAAYLSRIAQRLRETDESVMIYARTDAEGRWIYGQLKDAVPGYRVRGDIRIAQSPKITILPPLQ